MKFNLSNGSLDGLRSTRNESSVEIIVPMGKAGWVLEIHFEYLHSLEMNCLARVEIVCTL